MLNLKAVLILFSKYLLILVLYASLLITLVGGALKVHILLSSVGVVYFV